MGTRMGEGWYLHTLLKSMLIQYKTSLPKRYIILKFLCRRLVNFIIILGNGKLLNSVSDTFVNIVFKRFLSHHIKKGREDNFVDPKISKTFHSPKA